MRTFSLERAWRVLLDSLWLGLLRTALTVIQLAADALGLDGQGRRAVLARLARMLLPDTSAGETRAP